MFGDLVEEIVGDLLRVVRAAQVGRGDVVVEGRFHGLLERCGFFITAEKFHEQAGGKNCAEGVGNSLPGNVGGGAVDRLEERGAPGVDVGRGGEPEATSKLRGKVADDVAKKIVGDDDIELAGIADEFHGQRVDEE